MPRADKIGPDGHMIYNMAFNQETTDHKLLKSAKGRRFLMELKHLGVLPGGAKGTFVEYLTNQVDPDELAGMRPEKFEEYIGELKKGAVFFQPSSAPTPSGYARKAAKIAKGDVTKLTPEELTRNRQARVRLFEKMLGGKATDIGKGVFRIGPLLMLLAALGLLGRNTKEDT